MATTFIDKARITVRKGALIVGWELPPGGVVSEIK